MAKQLNALKKKVLKLLPVKYGSDLWWEKETEASLKEIKEGKIMGPFKSGKELIQALHQDSSR